MLPVKLLISRIKKLLFLVLLFLLNKFILLPRFMVLQSIVCSDYYAKKLLPWINGIISTDEEYFKAHGEPLFLFRQTSCLCQGTTWFSFYL
ncbi:hypothetical protein BD770DRAFT_401098 [Pilaira anomala]|nr:hypothetical protein BD770DRAFT_401098 [Pilaira anomala]